MIKTYINNYFELKKCTLLCGLVRKKLKAELRKTVIIFKMEVKCNDYFLITRAAERLRGGGRTSQDEVHT